jgi:NAD(P)-dependent dehydrogenase (short-subunit alcohol dehydrogenase family)
MSTFLVTGGNRGLGAETVKLLAAKGHHVVLTAREIAQGEETAKAVRAAHPSARLDVLPLELADLASVRACAKAFLDHADWKLHGLIANAAIYQPNGTHQKTPTGIELHMATNHLGHHLLASLLMERMRASAPARVTVLGSGLHAGVPGVPMSVIDFDDFGFDEPKWDGTQAYARSKLANILFAYELDRREKKNGVRSNVASPKVVPATVVQYTRGMQRFFMTWVMPLLPFARTPEQAAANTVWVATDPSLDDRGGLYFEDQKPIRSSPPSYDEAVAARLWEVSDRLTGITR